MASSSASTRTMLNEFYRVAFRRKIYSAIEQLQADLDAWLKEYNELRPHQGLWCYGKTPLQTFRESLPLAREKLFGLACAGAPARRKSLVGSNPTPSASKSSVQRNSAGPQPNPRLWDVWWVQSPLEISL
jgi:hypothetical protein